MNKQDYIAQLQTAIQHLHSCGAIYRKTVGVRETFQEKIIWDGDVEVFDLTGHPQAKRCYAWMQPEGKNDEKTKVVTVLEIPPVVNAYTALKVGIAAQAKTPKS